MCNGARHHSRIKGIDLRCWFSGAHPLLDVLARRIVSVPALVHCTAVLPAVYDDQAMRTASEKTRFCSSARRVDLYLGVACGISGPACWPTAERHM